MVNFLNNINLFLKYKTFLKQLKVNLDVFHKLFIILNWYFRMAKIKPIKSVIRCILTMCKNLHKINE